MTVDEDWPPMPLPELRIVDETLHLRPWLPRDAGALASAWSDPEVARRLEPPTGGIETARRWISGAADRLASGTAVDAAVVVDGTVAGEIGFHAFDRSRRAGLVGYWIGERHRGRGLAATALAMASRWWFDTLAGRVLLARCAVDNVGSWRAAEVAGFSVLAERDGERIMMRRSDDGPS